jgi:hypothetical protein
MLVGHLAYHSGNGIEGHRIIFPGQSSRDRECPEDLGCKPRWILGCIFPQVGKGKENRRCCPDPTADWRRGGYNSDDDGYDSRKAFLFKSILWHLRAYLAILAAAFKEGFNGRAVAIAAQIFNLNG